MFTNVHFRIVQRSISARRDKISEYDKELARQLIQGVASAKDIKAAYYF